jgi:hypothetical protein
MTLEASASCHQVLLHTDPGRMGSWLVVPFNSYGGEVPTVDLFGCLWPTYKRSTHPTSLRLQTYCTRSYSSYLTIPITSSERKEVNYAFE